MSLFVFSVLCRPNAIKWRAGQSIADAKPHREGGGRGGGEGDGDGEAPSSSLSEIRATELIRKGEEITYVQRTNSVWQIVAPTPAARPWTRALIFVRLT